MSSVKVKIESGMQLLSRLVKKPAIENFYPALFPNGPRIGEVIEFVCHSTTTNILIDLISEALIPCKLNGVGAGVLFFNMDGCFDIDCLISLTKKKLSHHTKKSTEFNMKLEDIISEAMSNFYLFNVYDANQFYTTIYSLETILMKNSNISLLVFDTLTAFYWSEQGFKITKMDLYIKSLIQLIQKVTKEYKITVMFTKPEYFQSNNDSINDTVNYQIQVFEKTGHYEVLVKKLQECFTKMFDCRDEGIIWL